MTAKFAIVRYPDTPGYALDYIQANSLVVGPLREMLENIQQSVARADAEARLEAAKSRQAATDQAQALTRAKQVALAMGALESLVKRMDALEAKEAEEERQRQEAEEKADNEARLKRIQSSLDDLYANSGELRPLAPSTDPEATPLDDQTTVATRSEPDPEDLAHPPIEEHPQPLAVQLNEA
jgi:hypothetical protein